MKGDLTYGFVCKNRALRSLRKHGNHLQRGSGTTCRCRACGAEGPVMSAADLACVNRAQLMGAQQEELDDLRRRYKNLGLTSWTTQQRVQID